MTMANLKIWHERLGHVNVRALKELTSSDAIDGVKLKENTTDEFFCDSCQLGKSHKLPFKKEVKRETLPGEFIHTDVCGPMPDESLGGARFFVLFKDDTSGFRCVYFIKHKSDTFEKFKAFEQEVKNRFNRPIKILRSDNGREYVNERFLTYMQSLGIVHEPTAAYTSKQNGKAERDNRTIVECARTMLQARRLPGAP